MIIIMNEWNRMFKGFKNWRVTILVNTDFFVTNSISPFLFSCNVPRLILQRQRFLLLGIVFLAVAGILDTSPERKQSTPISFFTQFFTPCFTQWSVPRIIVFLLLTTDRMHVVFWTKNPQNISFNDYGKKLISFYCNSCESC